MRTIFSQFIGEFLFRLATTIKTSINDVPCANFQDSMTSRGVIGLQVHGVLVPRHFFLRHRRRSLALRDASAIRDDEEVEDTDVAGAHRSKPEYSFFMSSTVAIETPELPTLP